MKPKSNLTPAFVAALMLIPLLYVGSYLAMVTPAQTIAAMWHFERSDYRFGHRYAHRFYWPLEQVDRMIRPTKWKWSPPSY